MHWLVPRLAGSSTELGRWPLLAVVIHRFVSLTKSSLTAGLRARVVTPIGLHAFCVAECLVSCSRPAMGPCEILSFNFIP